MVNCKYAFLQISLLILFMSSSFSYAHQKPDNSSSTPSPHSSAPIPPTKAPSNINGTFKDCFKKVYAFGGSYTDTGNAALIDGIKSFVGSLLNHSPYGSTTQLPGHRMSDGRLLIDFLCDALGLPPLPAYHSTNVNFNFGVNFAISGSTSLSTDYFSTNKIAHTLLWKAIPSAIMTQIDWFNKFLLSFACKGRTEAECKADIEGSLFWIGEIGADDYSRVVGSPMSGKWLTEQTVDQTCKILKALLDRGAKYIVVQGLAPLGCSPLDLSLCSTRDRDSMGCASSANAQIKAHNHLLMHRIGDFRKQHSDCKIIYADTWNAYRNVLTNYQKYQFEEPFKACCGSGGGNLNFDLHSLCGASGASACKNPSQHISWDGIHPTEAMHKQMADHFFNQGYCQPEFSELISAKKGVEAKKGK